MEVEYAHEEAGTSHAQGATYRLFPAIPDDDVSKRHNTDLVLLAMLRLW